MENCIFCKIIKREIPSKIIFEDEKVIAFNDIQPEAPIHVLVVPKIHIESIYDVNINNANILIDIHLTANIVAKQLGISDSGFRLITNCGIDAGQMVKHLHYHLLGGKKLNAKLMNNCNI